MSDLTAGMDSAEVVAFCSAAGDCVGDVVDNVLKGHVLGFDFFGNDADVGLSLKTAFECDMACRTAHQFDEVPVFFS